MAVKKAVLSGNFEDAIEKVNNLNPEVRIFLLCSLLHVKIELKDDSDIYCYKLSYILQSWFALISCR